MTPRAAERRSLLDAVLADPGDDAARLVFADWLEEYGDAHDAVWAEFIRVQLEMAAWEGVPEDPMTRLGWMMGLHREAAVLRAFAEDDSPCRCYTCLAKRERELLGLGSMPGGFNSHVPAGVGDWWWRRGFIDEVRLGIDDFVRHAAWLFGEWPVTRVVLTDRVPHDFRHHPEGQFWCWTFSLGDWLALRCLPHELWASCDGRYPTADAARNALSRACVRYGRLMAERQRGKGG